MRAGAGKYKLRAGDLKCKFGDGPSNTNWDRETGSGPGAEKHKYITIKSASYVTLHGITIDSKLNFKEHINNIVKKTYYKLYALRRLRKFLTLEKTKILACSMIESQFAYCPLIWMFCSKTDMQRVERYNINLCK